MLDSFPAEIDIHIRCPKCDKKFSFLAPTEATKQKDKVFWSPMYDPSNFHENLRAMGIKCPECSELFRPVQGKYKLGLIRLTKNSRRMVAAETETLTNFQRLAEIKKFVKGTMRDYEQIKDRLLKIGLDSEDEIEKRRIRKEVGETEIRISVYKGILVNCFGEEE